MRKSLDCFRQLRLVAAAAALIWPLAAAAQQAGSITERQQRAVNELIDSFNGPSSDPAAAASQIRRVVRAALLDVLRNDLEADGPSLGNQSGDVVVVEFFDYQCGYCRRVFGPLMDVVTQDGSVKVIVREYPIFGEASVNAAKAALAANKQGKYEAFHRALIGQGAADAGAIEAAAYEAEVDLDLMLADMETPEIAAEIEHNRKLARALELRGTPSFVIGSTFIPGAVNAAALRGVIEQTREAG